MVGKDKVQSNGAQVAVVELGELGDDVYVSVSAFLEDEVHV